MDKNDKIININFSVKNADADKVLYSLLKNINPDELPFVMKSLLRIHLKDFLLSMNINCEPKTRAPRRSKQNTSVFNNDVDDNDNDNDDEPTTIPDYMQKRD